MRTDVPQTATFAERRGAAFPARSAASARALHSPERWSTCASGMAGFSPSCSAVAARIAKQSRSTKTLPDIVLHFSNYARRQCRDERQTHTSGGNCDRGIGRLRLVSPFVGRTGPGRGDARCRVDHCFRGARLRHECGGPSMERARKRSFFRPDFGAAPHCRAGRPLCGLQRGSCFGQGAALRRPARLSHRDGWRRRRRRLRAVPRRPLGRLPLLPRLHEQLCLPLRPKPLQHLAGVVPGLRVAPPVRTPNPPSGLPAPRDSTRPRHG